MGFFEILFLLSLYFNTGGVSKFMFVPVYMVCSNIQRTYSNSKRESMLQKQILI